MSILALAVLLLALSITARGDNLFGLVTKDTAFLTTTSTFHGPSGVMMQSDKEWITPLAGGRTLLGLRGDPSDCDYLRSQLELVCNEHVLNFNGRPLSCQAIASYCRHLISKQLRSKPLSVQVLVAGWDDKANVPALFWLDEVGALQQVPYAAHGKELPFIFSVLDRTHALRDSASSADTAASARESSNLPAPSKLEELSAQQGLDAIHSCWRIINKRTSGYCDPEVNIISIWGASKDGVKSFSR